MTHFTTDDSRVVRALSASALIGFVDRSIARVWTAAATSQAGRAFERTIAPWRSASSAERSLLTGIVLVIAPITHVALAVTSEMPAGWLWLVLPGMSATVGVLLIASASTKA